jgi:phosphatidylserine decarboxylase
MIIIPDLQTFILIPIIFYIITQNLYVSFISFILIIKFMSSPRKLLVNAKQNYFYSPSSGFIRYINTTTYKDHITISMFLNIFDNHTQYIPVISYLKDIEHKYGTFERAYLEHSINNERVINTLYNPTYNFNYTITQITGLLTRRILSLQKTNDKLLNPGERLGFIMLGSRVDISIPKKNVKQILIKENMHISEMIPMIELQ